MDQTSCSWCVAARRATPPSRGLTTGAFHEMTSFGRRHSSWYEAFILKRNPINLEAAIQLKLIFSIDAVIFDEGAVLGRRRNGDPKSAACVQISDYQLP
jgi:hypothetical protein